MSLSHALLTSLIEKPSTGSELARRFDRSMGFFWPATHQQIYRELNNMLLKGWVSTLEDEHYTGRKKTYQVEASGRAELADWIYKQSPPAPLREELMVRLRAEAQLNTSQLLPELQRHLELHRHNLHIYQLIYNRDFAISDSQPNLQEKTTYIHKMILQLGINQEIGWITWLEQLIPQLQQFQDQH